MIRVVWRPEDFFEGLDLSGADLSGLDLSGCYMIDCNLSNVNFTNASFNRAAIHDCNCNGAIFDDADFYKAAIWGGTFDDTKFYTNLSRCTIERADLRKAQLDWEFRESLFSCGSDVKLPEKVKVYDYETDTESWEPLYDVWGQVDW